MGRDRPKIHWQNDFMCECECVCDGDRLCVAAGHSWCVRPACGCSVCVHKVRDWGVGVGECVCR